MDDNADVTTANESDAQAEPSWFIDEGIPGPGERPSWMPEKYKSVKQAMDARAELEKKLGSAPVGDYDFGEFKEAFNDHDAFKELASFAKEKRVPQEVFTKMLETVNNYGQSFLPNADAEKAKIGPDADRRIEVLGNWMDSNLSEGTATLLKGMVGDYVTADSVKALEEIRSKYMQGKPTIPNGSTGDGAEIETVEQLQKELQDPGNLKKFQEDSAYQSDWRRRVERASSNSKYVDKVGN